MKKIAILLTVESERIISPCRRLVNLGWRLIGDKHTVEVMAKENIPMEDVERFTGVGYEYGVPPTLHPKIEQALTKDCDDAIDLIFDVPYPLSHGNDIGGRTLLALGAKGRRLVINNYEDLERVLKLLEQGSTHLLDAIREELIAKVNFEMSCHYLTLAKRHSNLYDGILGQHAMVCREGENPYQRPCDYFTLVEEKAPSFNQLSGEPMCFTNIADLESIMETLNKLKKAFLLNHDKIPYILIAAKHGNPCGIGISWEHKCIAVNKALWGNPQALWGGEVVCNFDIDGDIAHILFSSIKRKEIYGGAGWMLDIIASPRFSDRAVAILGKRKQRKLISIPTPNGVPEGLIKWNYRFLRNGFLRQPTADFILNLDELEWTKAGSVDKDSILLAWASSYTSFHGGNEISLARDAMLIGVGGGPSTVMAAKTAVQWAKSSGHRIDGAVFCADAFFPFTDAPEILMDAGCKSGVVPKGGKGYDKVYDFFKERSVNVGFIPEIYRGFCRH